LIIDLLVLTKPKISLLNVLTAVVAYILAGGGLALIIHLMLAGYLSVGGASALNHLFDIDIDSKMRRTSKRPLPSGRLKPHSVLVFGSAILLFSLIYSVYFLNILTAFFIALGAFTYIIVYTVWLKRRSAWNIVIGGFAGSCSPLAGWAAAGSEIGVVPILLALIVFLWTPGHFWALAIRARNDYAEAGVPMFPVTYGVRGTAYAVTVSNIVAVAATLALIPHVSNPFIFFAATAPFSAYLLVENLRLITSLSPTAAWRSFKVSSPWLLVVFVSLLLAR